MRKRLGECDRRTMLTAAAAVALAGAAAPAIRPVRRGLIDVHHHIVPPALSGMPNANAWSPQAAVEGMDRAGIATGIAYAGPVLVAELGRRPAIARASNEFGAKIGRDHPGRFGLFAALPFPDVTATLAEIDYALDVLQADGFGIATSYGDKWLGDAAFAPIWERLNARGAVVFVHPQDAPCCTPNPVTYGDLPTSGPPLIGAWIEWPMNTARTIFSLMVTGTLRRFPRIRFVLAHGGGVMPLLVERLDNFRNWSDVGEKGLKTYFPNGVAAEFATLHFECAQAYEPPAFDALRRLVPDTQLLFGSDFPAFGLERTAQQFAALPLSSTARDRIGRGNAATLFPRWA